MHNIERVKAFGCKLLPTKSQLYCLICMTENNEYKYVASKLGISVKTVESHLFQLSRALKSYRPSKLIAVLRAF